MSLSLDLNECDLVIRADFMLSLAALSLTGEIWSVLEDDVDDDDDDDEEEENDEMSEKHVVRVVGLLIDTQKSNHIRSYLHYFVFF